MADYTVDEREIWVNLAACLLSGPSSNYLDVLSSSARPPQEGLEQTGSRSGRLKSRAEMDPHPVPSWVPKLKNGPYPNTMIMKDSLANAIGAARYGSPAFTAGITALKPSPQISQNGAVLCLDAVALERIEAIIPSSIFVSEILFDELPRFLESLAQLPHAYPVGNGTSFDAVATALCTLLTPQDSQGPSNSGIGNNMEQTSPSCLSSFDSRAPAWLCKVIVREVRIWVDDLRENMDKGTEKDKSTKKQQLQSLLSSYAHLSSKFPDLPWPQNIELGLAGTNKKLSIRTTMNGGSQPERVIAASFSKFATLSEQGVDRLQEWFPSKSESDKPDRRRREHWMYQDSDFPFVDRTQKTYSLSPKAQDFANALDLRLIFRNLFRTKSGLVGIGPNWLREGDQVMIVHGATVPYLFRSPDGIRRYQIQAMEKQLAEQEKERFLSRKENIAMLKEHITQLQSQMGSPGGWTLIGDTYIEGTMHGEALAGLGDSAFQRIAIV